MPISRPVLKNALANSTLASLKNSLLVIMGWHIRCPAFCPSADLKGRKELVIFIFFFHLFFNYELNRLISLDLYLATRRTKVSGDRSFGFHIIIQPNSLEERKLLSCCA